MASSNHRINMTRRPNSTEFTGRTEEGVLIIIGFDRAQWEALGSPDEFILRVR